ncbi:MAG: thiamine-phosphate kinase [Candidatus Omnitrophica bacterium]|nr:thiamine-phosphate kinase [Candidatus Omnitrophota bacterium]
MKTLKQLGEFNFIKAISKGCVNHKSVVKGIGDDAAVVKLAKNSFLLFTSDMIIEDVHFTRKQNPESIGHKAIACSLSDIAAMGGIPRYALISVAFPKDLKVSAARGIYRGMQRAAKKFGLSIIGGDTNSADKIIIDVSMCGEAVGGKFVKRDGARKGDIIFVTGQLGGSHKGKHLDFTPRLKEARFLIDRYPLHAMIDITDGLISDLGHIIAMSKKGAVIWQKSVPVDCKADSLEDAYYRGEDFELLFTVAPSIAFDLKKNWPFKKVKLTCIGEITEAGKGLRIKDEKGKMSKPKGYGWRHF